MDVEDEDDDTHLCIRCKKTIVGLENYIIHRKQMCMYLETSSSPLLNSESPDCHHEKSCVVNLTADDFFSSLELQSKTHIPKNSFMDTSSPYPKPLDASSTLSEPRLITNGKELYDISHDEPDTQCDLSNSSEDYHSSFFPPRSHTGGKWKPGSRPDIASHFQWDIQSPPSSPTEEIGMFDDNVVKFNDSISSGINGNIFIEEKSSLQKQSIHNVNECTNKNPNLNRFEYNSPTNNVNNKLKCEPCGKLFATKMDVMVHVLSQEHRLKFDDTQQWYDAVFSHQETLIHSSPFQCLICHYYFNNQISFSNHFRTIYHRQKAAQLKQPLLCVSCSFECRASDDLLSHVISKQHSVMIRHVSQYHPIVVREKVNKYNCHYCISACQMNKQKNIQETLCSSFTRHGKIKINSSGAQVKNSKKAISFCNQSNRNKVDMPDKSANISCSQCDKILSKPEDLQIHVRLNHPKKGYGCNLCDITFLTSADLEEHIKGHQKESPKEHRNCKKKRQEACSISHISVNIKFGHRKRRFLARRKGHQGKDFVKKYSCLYCNKFFSKTHLKYHIFTHTGEKPFKCHICNKGFAQKGTLSVHVKRHLGLKHLKCDKCDFRTFRKSVLQRHQETHKINRVRDSLCEICGAAYLDQWALKQHMLSHNGCDHKCTYPGCHHTFRRPSELVYHMRVHTNERPYLCDICGYSGKTSHQLKKHQRSHTGERPFKCKHCSYSAALSSQLVRHMRLHTGSKPYKCPYCSYTCNAQGNIRKHILKTKKHAGKKMYPCKFCKFACNELQEYREHLLQNHREHFPDGESQIDSSISGVYVKENPKEGEKLVPYMPHKKTSEHKSQSKPKKILIESNDLPKTDKTLLSSNEEQSNKEIVSEIPKLIAEEIEKVEDYKQTTETEHSEPVLYIAIPSTSDMCKSTHSENDYITSKDTETVYRNTSDSDSQCVMSVDDLITRTVSETCSNGADALGTQILISGGLDYIHAETNLADGSMLQLSNSVENNSENTIFIYMPFT